MPDREPAYIKLEDLAHDLQVDKSILVRRSRLGKFVKMTEIGPGIWRILRTDWDEWLLDNCTHNAGKIAGITAAAVNGTIQNPRPRNRGL